MVRMRPPICEVCHTRFGPRDGALLSFRPLAAASKPLATRPGVGHPEHQGWFCPEHAEDAEALTALPLGEALKELTSPMAAPGARVRRIFGEAAVTRSVAIEPRSSEGLRMAIIEARKVLAPLFDEMPNNLGSSSTRRPLPDQPVYPDAVDYRVSAGAFRAANDAIQGTAQTWYDSENRVVASHQQLTVTVDGSIRFVFSFVPEADKPLEYRRLVIQEEPVTAGAPEVRATIESFLAVFAVAEFDPLMLEPDLVGVDLMGGRLAGSVRFRSRSIEWDIVPTSVTQLEALFGDNIDRLARALDPAAAGEDVDAAELDAAAPGTSLRSLESSTKRTWNPMDGAMPPNCPFSDVVTSTGSVDGSTGRVAITMRRDLTHWSEHSVANASVSLMLQVPGNDEPFYLAASAPSGLDAATLRLSRPTSPEAIVVVSTLANLLASD